MNERTITLLLPGYITQVADPSAAHLGVQVTHACCDLFEFSEGHEQLPWQASLMDVLHTAGNPLCLPTARLALAQLREDNATSTELVASELLRADPIYLKADRDSAKLIPGHVLNLDSKEADELLAAINAFVKEDGLSFFRDDTDQWFVSGKSASDLESYPPSFLANRNTSAFMPEGPDSPYWRRLMTELQMLLHTHPVNQAREQNGLTPVNSVWFWGGGELPELAAGNAHVTVYADEPEAHQLAAHLQISCEPLSELTRQISDLPAAHSVILDTRLMQAWISGDGEQMANSLTVLNEQWLAPLSAQVKAGRLQSLQLITEDGLQGTCTKDTTVPSGSKPSVSRLQRIVSMFKR